VLADGIAAARSRCENFGTSRFEATAKKDTPGAPLGQPRSSALWLQEVDDTPRIACSPMRDRIKQSRYPKQNYVL
jgi:hypothetical protein